MEREEAIKWLKVINTREFGWDEFALQESQREIRERCEQSVREAIDMAIEALSVANLKEEFESAVPNCKKCAIKELWKEAEKEDLVAVVRCEDCVWSKEWNDNQIFCDRILMRLRENDFCSYGGRRK